MSTQRKKHVIATVPNDRAWVDRIAYEQKTQRQWSQKWKQLNDPKLYDDTERNVYPQKNKTTRWSVFSVLNPPDRAIILNTTTIANPPFFKITGNRDRFLDHHQYKGAPGVIKGSIDQKSPKYKPVKTGKYPCTSNSEYGWMWEGKSLEVFGSRR